MKIWIAWLQVLIPLVVLWKICGMLVEGIAGIVCHFPKLSSQTMGELAVLRFNIALLGISCFAVLVVQNGGCPDIAVATVFGYCLFNLLATLGICVYRRDLPSSSLAYGSGALLLMVVALMTLILRDGHIAWPESLAAVMLYGGYHYRYQRRLPPSETGPTNPSLPLWLSLLYLLGSLAIIGVACHFLVAGSIAITLWQTIPHTLLGTLVIAIGISIPNLVLLKNFMRHHQSDMVVATVVSGQLQGILIGLGLPLLVLNVTGTVYTLAGSSRALPFEKFTLVFSLFYLLISCVLFLICIKRSINRVKGIGLLAWYCIYCATLLISYVMRDSHWVRSLPIWLGF